MTKKRRPSYPGMLAAVLLAGSVSVLWAATAAAEPAIPSESQLDSWHENGAGGRYVLQMWDGQTPRVAGRIEARVLTDTDCTPDAQRLSHCHNKLALPDGSQITVIDNHEMMRHPCLKPGDKIFISSLNSRWILGYARR